MNPIRTLIKTLWISLQNTLRIHFRTHSRFTLESSQYSHHNPSIILTRIVPGYSSKTFQDSHKNLYRNVIWILSWFITIFPVYSSESSRILIKIVPEFSSEPLQEFHMNLFRILIKTLPIFKIIPGFFSESFSEFFQNTQQSPTRNPNRILIRIHPGF